MERENQRIAMTRRMLKQSMLKLLKEKKLDSINVTQLCREAGVNRATFYRHYEIPKDVLLELRQDFYLGLRSQVKIPKTIEDIRPVVVTLCECLNEHIDLLRVLIENNSDTDFASFLCEIYLESSKEYANHHFLKKLCPEDIQLVCLYCAGGSYFVLRNWVMGDVKKSPREIADNVYDLLVKTEFLFARGCSEGKKIT